MTTVGLMVVIDHFGFLDSLNSHKARSAAVLEAPYKTFGRDSTPSSLSFCALS